jgi:hypothetical protein
MQFVPKRHLCFAFASDDRTIKPGGTAPGFFCMHDILSLGSFLTAGRFGEFRKMAICLLRCTKLRIRVHGEKVFEIGGKTPAFQDRPLRPRRLGADAARLAAPIPFDSRQSRRGATRVRTALPPF